MRRELLRAYVVELLGTFALVYLSAGVVCINQQTVPAEQSAGATALLGQHPGLVGIALAQGFILAAALAATLHFSGGFLNPAISLMLWILGRMDTLRMVLLVGAQLVGALLAGLCLLFCFNAGVLREAVLGTPHLNPLAYPVLQGSGLEWGSWVSVLTTGLSIEFILTFILVFAIFGTMQQKSGSDHEETGKAGKTGIEPVVHLLDTRLVGLVAGMTLTACIMFGYPLTGAAINPARWFGTAFWEMTLHESGRGPFSETLVYTGGPTLGALVAGVVCFLVMAPKPGRQAAQEKKTRGK